MSHPSRTFGISCIIVGAIQLMVLAWGVGRMFSFAPFRTAMMHGGDAMRAVGPGWALTLTAGILLVAAGVRLVRR